jgi:hypothetical protein
MRHEAIYALYPNVVSVDDTAGAKDANGNSVTIDMDAVNAWVDPDAYKKLRASAYPPITDQLDTIYHEGIDAWKAVITAVKEEYPKP